MVGEKQQVLTQTGLGSIKVELEFRRGDVLRSRHKLLARASDYVQQNRG